MSRKESKIRNLANALRLLADELEGNPEVTTAISQAFKKSREPQPRLKKSGQEYPRDLDLYQLNAQGGEQLLRESLNLLDTTALKKVVSEGGFDPSQLALKWRKKERLVNLIVERVAGRARIGEVFRRT